ncbi:YggS family pyridoxal phosphate-dependent enzyme [Candidatus Woesearchaeota archaeon]|nr:YggS family pyridoxal phosphate-dependent enzyme [Candidatus Woesearchaeota archaeon]
MALAENYQQVMDEIREANRDKHPVTLVAVTKTRTVDEVNALIALGATDIGENRVQEAEGKFPYLKGTVRRHMIGHLQTNKTRAAVELFDVIHSVDSKKLAQKISQAALVLGRTMDVFIEVNVSGEESKQGVKPEEVEGLCAYVNNLSNIRLLGLMTMAPLVEPEQTRPVFLKLRELGKKLGLFSLSMGMSNDFTVAVEEGATHVRIGTALFGK